MRNLLILLMLAFFALPYQLSAQELDAATLA